ncbi:hypothetical protein D3C84_303340 [compost metagenome]
MHLAIAAHQVVVATGRLALGERRLHLEDGAVGLDDGGHLAPAGQIRQQGLGLLARYQGHQLGGQVAHHLPFADRQLGGDAGGMGAGILCQQLMNALCNAHRFSLG